MNNVNKYVAHRKDSGEDGEVLLIDFEHNYVNIRFLTTDKKYYYEQTYDLDDDNVEIKQTI